MYIKYSQFVRSDPFGKSKAKCLTCCFIVYNRWCHRDLLFSYYLCWPWPLSMNSPFLLLGMSYSTPQVSSVFLPSPARQRLIVPQDKIMLTLVG